MSALLTLPGQLRLLGVVLIALGLAHAALPKVLRWSRELAGLSLETRQVSYAHTFFIGLTCVLFGLLPLASPELFVSGGSLTRPVLVGYLIFWGLRLIFQLAVFSPRLWRGSRWRTTAHLAMTALWSWVVAVLGWALAQA